MKLKKDCTYVVTGGFYSDLVHGIIKPEDYLEYHGALEVLTALETIKQFRKMVYEADLVCDF